MFPQRGFTVIVYCVSAPYETHIYESGHYEFMSMAPNKLARATRIFFCITPSPTNQTYYIVSVGATTLCLSETKKTRVRVLLDELLCRATGSSRYVNTLPVIPKYVKSHDCISFLKASDVANTDDWNPLVEYTTLLEFHKKGINTMIIGPGGSGKTEMIKMLLHHAITKNNEKCAFVAQRGLHASRNRGHTIHTFF